MSKLKKTTLYIKGMHCPSCEILMRDKFGELKNVTKVSADHHNQTVEVCYSGQLDTSRINKEISQFGYEIKGKGEKPQPTTIIDYLLNITFVAVVFVVLYMLSQMFQFDFTFASVPSELSYSGVFLLGIIASTSTCMATSGALFLATVGKLGTSTNSVKQNFIPAVSFNVGRIIAYLFFGALIGLLGKTLVTTYQLGPFITVAVASFMILMGLDMAGIISFSRLVPNRWSGLFFEKLEKRLSKSPKKTAFWLGAITYFLPCGFTQSVQAYSLSLADPLQSALIMGIFALGTMPALLAIGLLQSFTKSTWYSYVTKTIGSIILILGLSYAGNFLSLYGVSFDKIFKSNKVQAVENLAPMENGFQVMRMKVNGAGYAPSSFTLRKGVPARWVIDGENVLGCQAALLAPQLGITKTLTTGENVLEFTPEKVGPVTFSCSMGMYRGTITVVET